VWLDEEVAVLGGVRSAAAGIGRVVLTDLAVMIADGGETIADIAVLADQRGLHGSVGSSATCWRSRKRWPTRVTPAWIPARPRSCR